MWLPAPLLIRIQGSLVHRTKYDKELLTLNTKENRNAKALRRITPYVFVKNATGIERNGIASQDSLIEKINFTRYETSDREYQSSQQTQTKVSTKIQTSVRNHRNDGKEIYNVAFLKVHKAASSTVQNILLRYGWKRNLTFVLPKIHVGMWPNVISLDDTVTEENTEPPPPGREFNILCNHVLFDYTAFRKIMPNDTKFIGIVRDPFSYFQSNLNYFNPPEIARIKNADDKILTFLKDPLRYEKGKKPWSFVNNRMAYEFGFPNRLFRTISSPGEYNITDINLYVETVKKQFDLVIVTGYFEESLLLMKRLLNWKLQDIIFVKNNVGLPMKRYRVLPIHRPYLEKWSVLDNALYTGFLELLLQKIKAGGQGFLDELLQYRRILKEVRDFCNTARGITDRKVYIEESQGNEGFTISSADCKFIRKKEMLFVHEIRKRQYPNETLSPEKQRSYNRMSGNLGISF